MHDVHAVPPPEAGQPHDRGQRRRLVQRSQAQPQDGAVVRLQRATFVIGTVEQNEGRLHATTVQLPDQREQLRLGAATRQAINQEADSDGLND